MSTSSVPSSCGPCPSQCCLSQFSHQIFHTNIEREGRGRSDPTIMSGTVAISARTSREFKSGHLMLILQGTVIVIILPALASKLYRVDVKHYMYVLNSFNQFLSDEHFSNLVPPRHKASYNLRHLHTFFYPSNEQIY